MSKIELSEIFRPLKFETPEIFLQVWCNVTPLQVQIALKLGLKFQFPKLQSTIQVA